MQITHAYSKKRTRYMKFSKLYFLASLLQYWFTVLTYVAFFLEAKTQNIQKCILNTEFIQCWNCFHSLSIPTPPPHPNLSMTRELLRYSLHTGLPYFFCWSVENGKCRTVCSMCLEVTTFLKRPCWQFDLFVIIFKLRWLNHASILPSYSNKWTNLKKDIF